IEKRRQELKAKVLPLLRPEMQERFARLEQVRADIGSQPFPEDQKWFREVLRKLDFLMEKFLHFGSKEIQFRTYLQSVLKEVRGERPQRARGREQEDELLFNTWVIPPPASNRKGRGAPRQPPRPVRDVPAQPEQEDLTLDPSDRWVQQTV